MFDDSINPLDFMGGIDLAGPRPAYAHDAFDRPAAQPALTMPQSLHATVKSSEFSVIQAALMESKSREEAAQKLGISPRTLRYKLARLRETPDALGSTA
jgi:two-component system response regulator FlrC